MPNMKSRLFLLLGVVRASLLLAFHPVATHQPPTRCTYLSIRSHMHVASKRRGSTEEGSNKVANKIFWNNMKRLIYNGVDGVNSLTSGESKDDGTRGKILDGYGEFEIYVKEQGGAPRRELLKDYEARASALRVTRGIPSISKGRLRTGFDAFKESLYSASQVYGQMSANTAEETPLEKLERRVPYKNTLTGELGLTAELFSDDPVKRFQAEQDIREQEARQRARARNQEIRAKKEDLYKLVDAMQAAVDALPEAMDRTEQTVKDTIDAVKTAPKKFEKLVDTVKGAPMSVTRAVEQTTNAVEGTVTTTKRIVEDVIDMPNKVTRSALETTETIGEGLLKARVLLRLEKPKPKPPNDLPPKPKTATAIASNVAGFALKSAGRVTWWATKSLASVAWHGVQSAIDGAREQNTELKISPAHLKDAVLSKLPLPTMNPRPSPTSKLDAQTEELRREVQEALRLAEEALRKTED